MEKMPLRQFMEETFNDTPIDGLKLASKLIELESIENWLRLMYGVELEIDVVPAEVPDGRFYGKSIAESLKRK